MNVERIVHRLVAVTAIAAMLGGTALVGVAGAQQVATPKNRVVMQVSDGDAAKWNLALNNARNLQTDLGAANVEIEIVAYGPGLGMLKKDSAVATRVDEALISGVKVVACENTMRAQKLTQPDMLPSIGYVAAGVVEIMQRQQQGWSYLRP
jgi:intracellular sulfur oxidation DsrE/DsrF family protein